MKIKPYYLVPAIFFALIVVGLYVGLHLNPRETAFALYEKPPPEFALVDLFDDEKQFTTSDLTSGNLSVVNFFASWCGPCRAEHPYLMALAAREDVRVFGIDYKDEPEVARAWLRTHGNPFQIIGADADGRAGIEWGLAGVPETFIVDKRGLVVYRVQGAINGPILNRQLLPLIDRLNQ